MDVQKSKSNVALLSVVSNSTLVVLKLVIGILIGSVAVISEAIHSGVDLIAALIAYFAVCASGKPADEDHPFGHGKAENVSGTIEAILIFLAAAWIIYEAVKKLLHLEHLEAPALGVMVMLVSVAVNIIVSQMLFKVGKRTDSVALLADAWHLRTDVYTSAGVTFGLAALSLGDRYLPNLNLHWIDPVAAILVALLIVKAAWDLTRQSARDLMDTSLPDDEIEVIRECICRPEQVLGYHKLLTRKAGAERFVECHIFVDSELTVDEAHEITRVIVADIRSHFRKCKVTLHVEPCTGKCGDECAAKCLLTEEEKLSRMIEKCNQ